MGLISATTGAVGGTIADQWVDFFTAPSFGEQTVIAPGWFQTRNRWRGSNTSGSANIITDGSRIAVPENTAVIITDGDGIASVSTEPGYFVYRNDGQPSVFSGSSARRSLIDQAWERFKLGGQPGEKQLVYYVNLREIRGLRFGTPGPLPYQEHSLVPEGSQLAPVLRIKARGQYSVGVADPIRFFRTFLPAGRQWYSFADEDAVGQVRQEFLTAFQGALQSLSRSTAISSLASHGPELAAALTNEGGPGTSWLERFGLEIVSVAVSAIEYDAASLELMDKYNQGTLLGGGVGNAYAQTAVADAARSMADNGSGGVGMMGLAMGTNAASGTLAGLTQPAAPTAAAPPAYDPNPQAAPPTPNAAPTDPVAVLSQLKTMLDQGLITPEQYRSKQEEILGRM